MKNKLYWIWLSILNLSYKDKKTLLKIFKEPKEIYKTTLDIRIGYLHATNNRYESLNLDLADIFKPIIVDKIIFKVINKKIINKEIHFEKRDDGVFLNEKRKKNYDNRILFKNVRLSENKRFHDDL